MKRKLLATTIIVAIAIMVGTPYATGMMAEKHYRSMISANPFTPSLQMESRNYERGIFSSQATTFVEINDPELRQILVHELGKDKNGKVGVVVRHHISHSPLIFGSAEGIDLAVVRTTHQVEQNGSVENSSGQQSEHISMFQLDSRLHFDGSQTVEANSRETLTRNNRATTRLLPFSIKFVTDKNYRTFQGDGEWKGATSESNRGEKISISDTRFKFDMEKNGEIWHGAISLSVNSIALNSPKRSLQIDLLKAESRSSEHGAERLIDYTTEVSLHQLRATGKTFGPGELILTINNIPAAALERLNTIQQRAMNASSPDHTIALQTAGIEAMGLLPELISHGISIDMERLYFNTPDGEIVGRINLRLPKSNPASLLNIPYLKSIIKLDAGFSLPATVVPDAMMKNEIRPLIERNDLILDGNSLKSKIRMSAGVLKMNNRVVALPY